MVEKGGGNVRESCKLVTVSVCRISCMVGKGNLEWQLEAMGECNLWFAEKKAHRTYFVITCVAR